MKTEASVLEQWEVDAWTADAMAHAIDALLANADVAFLRLKNGEVSISAVRALVLQMREHMESSVRARPKSIAPKR